MAKPHFVIHKIQAALELHSKQVSNKANILFVNVGQCIGAAIYLMWTVGLSGVGPALVGTLMARPKCSKYYSKYMVHCSENNKSLVQIENRSNHQVRPTVMSVDFRSLRVPPLVEDKRVYAIVAKSLLPYITSVSNVWNVIYAKLFVK